MSRIVVGVVALAAFALLVASPVSATTPRYSLSGVETGVPQSAGGGESTSAFAGTAFSWSAGPATWSAHVTHRSLAACATLGNACITGGSLKLSGVHTVSGTFSNGSINLVSGNPVTCTSTSVYRVTGLVALVGGGTATFTARLTHYQVKLFGSCVPYFATVSGTFG